MTEDRGYDIISILWGYITSLCVINIGHSHNMPGFFLCTWKKTQPTKKLKIWKKTHGFSEKNSRYRDLTVIALHREPKKNSKNPKKNSKNPKKTQKISKKTHVTGIWQLSNPAKVHKKACIYAYCVKGQAWYNNVFWPNGQVDTLRKKFSSKICHTFKLQKVDRHPYLQWKSESRPIWS